MKKVMFVVFTFVYVATAIATLLAYLAQARLIPSGLEPGEQIPLLELLVSAVLVETVAGYLGLAKNLFGLRESEKEVRILARTAMKVLSRLQGLAYRYSLEARDFVQQLQGNPIVGPVLEQFGVATVSERARTILDVTKSIEAAIADVQKVLLTDDAKKIRAANNQLSAYLPTLEAMLVK